MLEKEQGSVVNARQASPEASFVAEIFVLGEYGVLAGFPIGTKWRVCYEVVELLVWESVLLNYIVDCYLLKVATAQ
ncbi:hypothetical protein NOSIN_00215 [Nocardiopsis sinuspersici]|uniref:Uncharacterized protein n=1 Tax=Nocardiopsis sinuspersici TaxID=501010 RepID=A0A1V3BVP7_9ACTN|nr:hypothetical protein NOSIN_00215 [Nocardiopsis sinuspersici]